MKGWRFVLASCSLAMCGVACAQKSSDTTTSLTYEHGTIANNTYSNDCFGLSLPIPAGWSLISQSTAPDVKARHVSGGVLLLLVVEHRKEMGIPDRIILTARGAGESGTAQDFVAEAVHSQINSLPQYSSAGRDAAAVDYGGKHFSRAEYKQSLPNRDPQYVAYVYTKFRGYFIGETLMAGSQEELDRAANSLQAISFEGDQANPKCVMQSTAVDPPERVRVSQTVSVGLLIKRVNPEYPEKARKERIQGQVVLQAEINKNGDIENLFLISGHPLLAAAAMEAVKQWKYRPYLLDGKAVSVDTQIIVNFTLSRF